MHQFRFDARRGRLYQRLTGFLSLAQAHAVRDQVTESCDRVRAAGGRWSMLSDLSNYPPQSQEVGRVGEEIAAAIAGAGPTGFAIVTGSALQRLRLRRVMDAAQPRYFASVEEAVAFLNWEPSWLVSPVSSPDTLPASAPPRAVLSPAGR